MQPDRQITATSARGAAAREIRLIGDKIVPFGISLLSMRCDCDPVHPVVAPEFRLLPLVRKLPRECGQLVRSAAEGSGTRRETSCPFRVRSQSLSNHCEAAQCETRMPVPNRCLIFA